VVLFEDQGVKLEVNLKDETVWLILEQMSELLVAESNPKEKEVIIDLIMNFLNNE